MAREKNLVNRVGEAGREEHNQEDAAERRNSPATSIKKEAAVYDLDRKNEKSITYGRIWVFMGVVSAGLLGVYGCIYGV